MCMDGPSNAPGSGHAENVPLATGSVLAQVAWRTKVDQIHLEPVVGPRTELERTSLFVERKVGHVDTTRAFRHCRDDPQHVTSRSDDRSCLGENLCRRFSFVHTAVTIITVTSLAQPTDYVPIRHKWKDRSPLFGSSNYGWKNWRTLTKAKVWLVLSCGYVRFKWGLCFACLTGVRRTPSQNVSTPEGKALWFQAAGVPDLPKRSIITIH